MSFQAASGWPSTPESASADPTPVRPAGSEPQRQGRGESCPGAEGFPSAGCRTSGGWRAVSCAPAPVAASGRDVPDGKFNPLEIQKPPFPKGAQRLCFRAPTTACGFTCTSLTPCETDRAFREGRQRQRVSFARRAREGPWTSRSQACLPRVRADAALVAMTARMSPRGCGRTPDSLPLLPVASRAGTALYKAGDRGGGDQRPGRTRHLPREGLWAAQRTADTRSEWLGPPAPTPRAPGPASAAAGARAVEKQRSACGTEIPSRSVCQTRTEKG